MLTSDEIANIFRSRKAKNAVAKHKGKQLKIYLLDALNKTSGYVDRYIEFFKDKEIFFMDKAELAGFSVDEITKPSSEVSSSLYSSQRNSSPFIHSLYCKAYFRYGK